MLHQFVKLSSPEYDVRAALVWMLSALAPRTALPRPGRRGVIVDRATGRPHICIQGMLGLRSSHANRSGGLGPATLAGRIPRSAPATALWAAKPCDAGAVNGTVRRSSRVKPRPTAGLPGRRLSRGRNSSSDGPNFVMRHIVGPIRPGGAQLGLGHSGPREVAGHAEALLLRAVFGWGGQRSPGWAPEVGLWSISSVQV